MTQKTEVESKLLGSPKWTNPYVGLCSMIATAANEYGNGALKVMSDALTRVGRKTGEYLIERGIVEPGCSIAEWGAIELETLQLRGIYQAEVIQSGEDDFVIRVPDCGYQEPFRYMNAPREICSVPWCWDEGELQTVNPELHLEVAKCAYRGDDCCTFHLKRQRRG